MIIAAAEYEGKIATYFEEVEKIRLFKLEKDVIKEIEPILLSETNECLEIIEKLQKANANLLICGSLDAFAENSVRKSGIKLIRDIEGLVEDSISAYLAGYIEVDERLSCTKNGQDFHM